MSQPIRGWGGHLVFPISPKNTNLVEDFEILLPVKFLWILFSSFIREVENFSANQRLGRPSCFSDQPEKHKLGRGLWDLASYQVLLNSVQRFQRRSRKCLSQSEARAAILFFRSAGKTQTRKRTLRSSFLSIFVEFRSAVSEEKSKMWKFTDGRTDDRRTDDGRCAMTIAHLSLRLRWAKKKNQEVENVSADQRPGRPSYFSDRPEKHKLGRGHWDLLSCQVLLHFVPRFQRRSRKCLSQLEAGADILFFRSARKTQTW